MIRIGLSAALEHATPLEWAQRNASAGCRCVNFPINYRQGEDLVQSYVKAAGDHDLLIAEVGVWRNPVSPFEDVRTDAIEYAVGQLRLADSICANCAVNVAGSMGERWDGAYKDNFTKETWKKTVKSIQTIIDEAAPKHTYYTIEPMPWMYPISPDEYLHLIEDVGRDRFAVHMDIFNSLTTPYRYFFNEEFMEEVFEKLGRYIKSCHIKDVLLEQDFTMMYREVKCGGGIINLEKYAELAARYNPDMPMIIEHLHSEKEYLESIEYVKRRLKL